MLNNNQDLKAKLDDLLKQSADKLKSIKAKGTVTKDKLNDAMYGDQDSIGAARVYPKYFR